MVVQHMICMDVQQSHASLALIFVCICASVFL
jgi:hypothetical protein